MQPGRAAAKQVVVPLLEVTGAIHIFNANGPADVIVDVTGFFA